MTEPQRPAQRRPSLNFDFECNSLRYTASVSYSADGRLLEIFLSNHKSGSHADIAARAAAIVCSIALQYHIPIDEIRHALPRNSHGNAATPLGAALDIIVGGAP